MPARSPVSVKGRSNRLPGSAPYEREVAVAEKWSRWRKKAKNRITEAFYVNANLCASFLCNLLKNLKGTNKINCRLTNTLHPLQCSLKVGK